ncbi:alpha/beta hydrolase, partial [Myxococcota bacterium]|nr:alpha/beta hydrolase [Myxococcota bacterium]
GTLHGQPGDMAVVASHGMLSNRNGDKHKYLGDLMAQKGVAFLRFDFAGLGESEGELFDISYSHEVEDLQAASEFLFGMGVKRLGYFGSSMGGAVALLAAARDERVVAIATLAAVGHTDLIMERHLEDARSFLTQGYVETDEGRVGRGFYDDAMQHDVLSATRMILAPILVMHGDRDEVVPSSDGHDIASEARRSRLEVYFGADHRFTRLQDMRSAMNLAANFLEEHLIVEKDS